MHFSVSQASYTDFKDITVGIPESMIGRTKEEIIADAKWRTAHEVGHLIYTDHAAYKKFIEDFANYMDQTHSINKGIGKQVANHLINAIEDGREEHMMILENPGLLKYYQFGRGLWWHDNPTIQVEAGTEIQRELFDTLFSIATLATMGTLPKNYAEIYGENEDLFDMIKKMKVSINRYVNNSDPKDAINNLWTLVNTMEDWLVNLMKQIPEPDLNDMMNQLNQQAGANGSPINDSAGSAGDTDNQQSSGNGDGQSSSKNNQTNPIHKSFTNKRR